MNPDEIKTIDELMGELDNNGLDIFETIDFINNALSKITLKQVIQEVCDDYNEMIDEVVDDEEELEDEV